MHVAGCAVFDGAAPRVRGAGRGDRRRGCTSSRATASGSRSCRSIRAGRCGSTTPTSTSRYHVRHTALPRPGGDDELKRLAGPRVLAGARPQPAAVGAVARRGARRRALRAAVEDPSRARRRDLRRRHRDGAVRCLARSDAGRAARAGVGRAAAADRRPAAGRRAARAQPPCRRDRARRPGARCGDRARSRAGSAGRSPGSARWPGPASSRRRRARSTCGSGRTAGSPGSAATSAEFKAIKNALGGTVNDVVLAVVAGALGRYMRLHGHRHRGRRAQGDGSRCRCAPTSSAARSAIGRGDVGAAARRDDRSRSSGCATISDAMEGVKESGQAVGAQILTRLSGLRPADDHGAGGPPAGPPAAVQPGGHERARARSSRCTCSAASSRRCTRWSRWPRTPRSGSRS